MDEIRRDFDDDLDPSQRDSLVALAMRLKAEVPVPAPGFRDALRRDLLGKGPIATDRAPRANVGPVAVSYCSIGLFLLAVAAAGIVDTGPFAAG